MTIDDIKFKISKFLELKSSKKNVATLFKKWKEKGRKEEDVLYHLFHHFQECRELIEKKDEHRYAEVMDLLILCQLYLDYGGIDYNKLKTERLRKFEKKLEEC